MKRTFGVAFSILAAFLVCEVLARAFLWAPPLETDVGTPRQGLTRHAIGDWVPNQRGVWVDGRLEYPYFVQINGAGFRNIEEFDPDAFRILVLGDSQTFGLFVASHDIWTNVAEKRLNARSKTRIQLLNNGLPGSTISDHLAYLNEKGHKLSPDMVLLVVNSTDIVDLQRDGTSVGFLRSFGLESTDSVPLNRLRWFLRHKSGLYVAARELKERLIVRRHEQEARDLDLASPGNGAAAVSDGTAGNAEKLRAKYERLLVAAIVKIRALGGEPVLAFLSAPWDEAHTDLAAILERTTRARRVAHIEIAPAFDGFRRNQATWYRDPEIDPSYPGDGHFNRLGNLLIGQHVADRLAPVIAASLGR